MAKGYDTNKQRQAELSLFGKDLARRSKSHCELSGASQVALRIYEVEPTSSIPDFSICLFVSEHVIEQLESPKKRLIADEWRHLNELIWSDLAPVQVMSYRILSFIAKDHLWAKEILDEAFLDEETLKRAEQSPL